MTIGIGNGAVFYLLAGRWSHSSVLYGIATGLGLAWCLFDTSRGSHCRGEGGEPPDNPIFADASRKIAKRFNAGLSPLDNCLSLQWFAGRGRKA